MAAVHDLIYTGSASPGDRTEGLQKRIATALAGTSSASSPWVAGTCTLILVTMMLGTMSITAFQRQWLIFLCGVLTAAVFACVSYTANARWVIARRTAQIEVARRRLAEERRLRLRVEASLAPLRAQVDMIDVALPAMVAYVDADHVVRYHNQAYTRWVGRSDQAIDGRSVEEVLGVENYALVEKHLDQALEGREVRYERTQRMDSGEGYRLFAHYLPHYRDGKVAGLFAILSDITAKGDFGTGSSEDEAQSRAVVAAQLNAALEQGEFCLYTQRIASLEPGAQALPLHEVSLRLMEEEKNHLPPGAFLQIAEELDLLPRLDRWVLGKVFDLAATFSTTRRGAYLVNIAPATIAQAGLAEFIGELLAARKLPGSALCLEFAEADVTSSPRRYRDLIESLRRLGCRFAVSGFGRHPRALPLLKQLGVNYLKLDSGMVLGVAREPAELSRLEAINDAAHAAGMFTLADCVEDDGTRALLQGIHTDYVQGSGVSRAHRLEPSRPAVA